MPPEINYGKCTGCGICRETCSEDVFFDLEVFEANGKSIPKVTYPEACFNCYLCVENCPEDAIHIRTPLVMHVPYK